MLKLTLPNLDGLEESTAALYAKQDDGSYKLQVEGAEDTAALKRARDHEKAEKKEAQRKAAEAEKKLQDLEAEAEKQKLEAQKKGGKFDEIQAGYEQKLKDIEEKYQAQIAERDNETVSSSRTSKISELSNKFGIQGKAKALEPHIRDMVETELVEGKVVHFLKQGDGSKIPLTEDGFTQAISKVDYLSDLIVGTKGSGGGAPGNPDGGGAPNGNTKIDFASAKPSDVVAAIEAKEKTA